MDDLIEALQILRKYGNAYAPTHCINEILLVDVPPEKVSDEDKKRLEELGFEPHDGEYGDNMFESYRFGSC